MEGETATIADWLADPPAPVQVSVNVVFAVRPPVLPDPEIAFVPDHPLEAEHDVALVELQASVDELPDVTVVGLADIKTVGAVDGGVVDPTGCSSILLATMTCVLV